jgi:hypothetical protein
MNSKFLFSNLPAPLFIKEGIISSFHHEIHAFPPFLKGDIGGLLNIIFSLRLLYERTKIIIAQVSKHSTSRLMK